VVSGCVPSVEVPTTRCFVGGSSEARAMQNTADLQHASVAVVHRTLLHDLHKMRHFFFMPVYLIFTVILVSLLVAQRVNFRSSTAPIRFQLAAQHVIGAKQFTQITDRSEFMPWLHGAVERVSNTTFEATPLQAVKVLGLRQIRSERRTCESRQLDQVDPYTRGLMLARGCILTPKGALPAFGVNGSFKPRVEQPADDLLGIVRHRARFFDMRDASAEYAESVFIAHNWSDTNASLTRLDELGWVDEFSAGLVVEFVVYFPDDEIVAIISLILEVTPTGLLSVEVRPTTFEFFVNKALISLDIAVLVIAVVLTYYISFDMRENHHIHYHGAPDWPRWRMVLERVRASLGFWELYTFGLLVGIWVVVFQRFSLFSRNLELTSGVATERAAVFNLYNLCILAEAEYQALYDMYCFAIVVVCFRLFYTFQYVAGLSVITTTLRRSAPMLLRVGGLLSFLLVIFAMTGSMIFGQVLYRMRTFPHAIVFLVTILVSAEVYPGDYNTMLQVFGVWADVYLTIFYLLFWLILINLVIAVISSSHMSSREDCSDADSVLSVVQIYGIYTHSMYSRDNHAADRPAFPLSSSNRVAGAALSMRVPVRERFTMLRGLRLFRCRALVSLQQLNPSKPLSLTDFIVLLKRHEGLINTSDMSVEDIGQKIFNTVLAGANSAVVTANETAKMHVKMEGTIDWIRDLVHRLRGRLVDEAGDALTAPGRERALRFDFERHSSGATSVDGTPSALGRGMSDVSRTSGLNKLGRGVSFGPTTTAALGGAAKTLPPRRLPLAAVADEEPADVIVDDSDDILGDLLLLMDNHVDVQPRALSRGAADALVASPISVSDTRAASPSGGASHTLSPATTPRPPELPAELLQILEELSE
jgi:hypothetical protein